MVGIEGKHFCISIEMNVVPDSGGLIGHSDRTTGHQLERYHSLSFGIAAESV